MNRFVNLCLCLLILLGCTTGVSAQTQGDDIRQALLEIQELAKKGELRGCPFPIGASIDSVFEKWGVIDPIDWGSLGVTTDTYEYPEKNTTIALNSNKQIKWISVWLPFKTEVTAAEVKEVFGEPTEGDSENLIYEFDKNTMIFSNLGHSQGNLWEQTSLHFLTNQ